jgi:sortase (surface protein transpeptidase)
VRHSLTAVAALLLLVGCGGTAETTTPPTERAGATPQADAPSPPTAAVTDAPDPQNLTVPELDVSSSLVPLGLTEEGQHEVPPLSEPGQAGWYKLGPEPGEIGAAIILGHVNGNGQPGVFANLDDLAVGDEIIVDELEFQVYAVDRVPKDDFPAETVYGGTTSPEVLLITCGGAFDSSSGNYVDNIIVSATIKVP